MSTRTRQISFFEQLKTEEDVIAEANNHRSERPETYTGMYGMHKYWSKKPHNLVARYIERYSESGEIVLDPFCGSGVTAIESVRLNRRAIGLDVNLIAVLCTQMGLEHVDIKALQRSFDLLGREVEKETNSILSPARAPARHPTIELIANNRINAKAGTRIGDLFTPRALSGLSFLLEKVRQIEDQNIRQVMEFCFSAMLPQASNMVFVIRRRGKFNGKHENEGAEVGSWVIGYWLPEEHFEIHVWRCFANRFRRILKGKQAMRNLRLKFTWKEEAYETYADALFVVVNQKN